LYEKYGFDAEFHSVVTDDGYILELHRITGLQNRTFWEKKLKRKPVVLLMHGMGGDSANWCIYERFSGLGKKINQIWNSLFELPTFEE
jgi:hypothetical protein